MNHSRARRSIVAGVVVAGVAVGLGVTAVAADRADDRPASHRATDQRAMADWAIEQHLSGLSPASLAAADSPVYPWSPDMAAQMAAIAEYARANGLVGLSPASLQASGD